MAKNTISDIMDNLSFLDDWEERYKYILDLGKKLDEFPQEKKNDNFLVKGCVSQVWLDYNIKDGKLFLSGDSDSHLVRGLLALVFIIFSEQSIETIKNTDFKDHFHIMGLSDHLTPQRSNGLFSVVNKIKSLPEQS